MPIRIEKDPDKGSSGKYKQRGGGRRSSGGNRGMGGLGGGIVNMLLPLLMKKPKLLIVGGILFAIWYFGIKPMMNSDEPQNSSVLSSLGAEFNPKIYDEAKVFEPLADNKKNPLPEKTSLLKYAPDRLSQGKQGSCVAWASAYAARSIMQARATNKDPNDVAFSPSFLYNQIALENCQGSYIKKAMEHMKTQGSVPFSKFSYDDGNCTKNPNSSLKNDAQNYPIMGYNRLTKDGNNHATDMLAIKQNLAQGAPVVIGMMVGGTFMTSMKGQELWVPTGSDLKQRGFGGHAMCVIGYDDYYDGKHGAFQIMNSWGEEWGKKGIFWMYYNDFDALTREAYGLFPMADANEPRTSVEKIELGIAKNEGGYFALQKTGDITFSTQGKVDKETRFKLEVGNTKEAYIYVFGQETDNTTYTLFPYTEKHSPYCGITGTRLFPKDHSLYVDDMGTEDYFAVLVTNQPLDYSRINSSLTSSRATTLEDKIKDVFANELISYNSSISGNTINMDFEFNKAVAAMVIRVEK